MPTVLRQAVEPRSIRDCVLFIDPARLGAYYAEAATVDTARNLVSDANHPTQGTDANRPTFRANIFGPNPGLLFDGASDFLAADGLGASFSGDGSAPLTCVCAVKHVTTATLRAVWALTWSGSDNTYWAARASAAGHDRFIRKDNAGITKQSADSGGVSTTAHVSSVTFTATTGSLWQDGANTSRDIDADISTSTLNRFTLGARRYSSTGDYANMYLGALALYTRSIADAERRAVEAWMQRWAGLTSQVGN